MQGVVSSFYQKNLSKLNKVHAFQKENTSNELNMFFFGKIKEGFQRYMFNI